MRRATAARLLVLTCVAAAPPARAADCAPPDLGTMPYHRVVARIKYLPEIETWSRAVTKRGGIAQYVLMLDTQTHIRNDCYWTLEVREGGERWARFFVTPDGETILAQGPRGPVALGAWRAGKARQAAER